jgi:hypothetical protein
MGASLTSAWGNSWGDAWGENWSTADVIEPPVEVPAGGGGFALPVAAIVGVGNGILPQFEGRAYGYTIIAGKGRGVLPALIGDAFGDASGAQLRGLVAAARGHIGVAGGVRAVCLPVTGTAIAVRGDQGRASGVVQMLKAGGCGHHDPDEASIIAFLMAA